MSPPFSRKLLIPVLLCAALASCYKLRDSAGGGQTTFTPPRNINAADVALPDGYRIEAVASGLTFPTGVTFDEAGDPYVVEAGYSYGEEWTIPRLIHVDPERGLTTIAANGKNGPWTGVVYHDGAFYVAEGGELGGGKILRISKAGEITPLVEELPSRGDHHTNGPAIGPDGLLYFCVGTYTNSGVVGVDNAKFGWLERYPDLHDIPCRDIVLTGRNYTTPNPLKPGADEQVETGAFSPFGTRTESGQIIRGRIPCSGSVLRIKPDGSGLDLVAWGFRNPFGIAFSPDGGLFVTENQYDVRGSRPVFGTGDLLWSVKPGTWYGWPDYHGNHPLGEGDDYKPPNKPAPEPLLAGYPNPPPKPVAILGVHASANGFDFSRNPRFGYTGDAFIAEFGDQAPEVGKVLGPVGFKVVRVNVRDGVISDFAVNKGETNGPASLLNGGGLERPIAARFNPEGTALYVVDFGVMLMDETGSMPRKGTGVLWRITRNSTSP